MNITESYTNKYLTNLSSRTQLALCSILIGLGIITQILFGIEYLVAGVIAVAIATILFRSPFLLLFSYISVLVLVGLRDKKEALGLGLIELVTAAIMCLALVYIIHYKLFLEQKIVLHPSLFFVFGYAIWTLLSGLITIATSDTTVNFWFREFLSFSPLLVIPTLLPVARKNTPAFDKKILLFLSGASIIIFVMSLIKIKSNALQATYLYQTGTARYDVMNNAVMILLFLGIAGLLSKWKSRLPYIGGIFVSFAGLFASFVRTSWVGVLIVLPIFIVLTPKIERRRVKKTLLFILMVTLLSVLILYFSIPIVRAVLGYSFAHFSTSSKVGTDPSIVNRYIEWGYVFKQFFQTPISGVGFGGQFTLYNWLGGETYRTGYTHNGIMVLLLKGGIVGLIFMATAFISFFKLGIKMAYSRYLSDQEKMIARVGLFTIVFMMFHMMTLGLFIHREVMWYLGLVWGYFISFSEQVCIRTTGIESNYTARILDGNR